MGPSGGSGGLVALTLCALAVPRIDLGRRERAKHGMLTNGPDRDVARAVTCARLNGQLGNFACNSLAQPSCMPDRSDRFACGLRCCLGAVRRGPRVAQVRNTLLLAIAPTQGAAKGGEVCFAARLGKPDHICQLRASHPGRLALARLRIFSAPRIAAATAR